MTDVTLQGQPSGIAASRGRILLADDDAAFREGLSRLLNRHGFECASAGDAQEAKTALAEGEFETVISDIHMPGNCDLEFVVETAASHPGLPLILLTGQPGVETAVKSVRLAVAGYIVKPPAISELTQLADESIARFRRLKTVRDSRHRVNLWAEELKRVEESLETDPRGAGASDFLRLTLHNIALQLSALARPLATASHLDGATDRIERAELISALQQTVATLEQTRKSFKSRELGELRRQLELMLAGKTASGTPAAGTKELANAPKLEQAGGR